MARNTTGIVVVGAVALAGLIWWWQANHGGGSGPTHVMQSTNVSITLNDDKATCTLTPPPPISLSIKNGDSISWSETQGYPFSIDFEQYTGIWPGTPFRDLKNRNKFNFSTVEPNTGAAHLGILQPSNANFYIHTIIVLPTGGTPITCYNSDNIKNTDMKVIVTQ